MRISKYFVAVLAGLLIVLTVMSGCSASEQSPTTPPTVAPTEPEELGIEIDAYNGSELKEFAVGDIVKFIDEGAFANCKALENFYCSSRDISIHENAFSGTENVVFHCYLDSTADLFARKHGYDCVYFDAFSIQCDTVKNGCVGLPITWSAVDVMPGQNIESQFVYTVNLNNEPIFTAELTTEDSFVYTPTEGGQYSVTVEIVNDMTTASLTSQEVPVADQLIMGMYEQDDDDTATEPIVWRIIAVEDGKALVLSDQILTKGSYFNPDWIKYKYTYWAESCVAETSSVNYWGSKPADPKRQFSVSPGSVPLNWKNERGPEEEIFYVHARYWCNEVFYKENLSEEEQKRVVLSNLTNPGNPQYRTKGGPDSQDYVFFLSYEELDRYLPTREDRKTTLTTFAHNIPLQYGTNDSYYWLRSPGQNLFSAVIVWGGGGIIAYTGADVGHNNVGYRPAMWITIGG